jgi:hypothetical protein
MFSTFQQAAVGVGIGARSKKREMLLGSRQWKERHCAIAGRCGSSRAVSRIASMFAIAQHVSAGQVQLCIPALPT